MKKVSSTFWKIHKRLLKLAARHSPGYKIRIGLLKGAGYTIGKDVYIGEDLIIIDKLDEKGNLFVGNRVAIAARVILVISSRPNFSRIAPFVPTAHGPITIEDDAWLGTGAIVMPNTTIGQGSVVGAAALVLEDVPPFTIVAGVPAKPIRKFNL
ncbi:MAG: acyltransferase [Deltaproteobacteria bacterium]|nr:acyltransferase [Deltaproteobacteria bacterium]